MADFAKRHYERLGEMLVKKFGYSDTYYPIVLGVFVEFFQKDNPRFDEGRFRKFCDELRTCMYPKE